MSEPILQMKNISKVFPGVQALKDVHLDVYKGKVHALMGENGAGKSTLMKVLIGIHPPTEGEVYLKGKKVSFANTKAAIDMGISMIHQELSPVYHRSIGENIWLGREPTKGILKLIDHKKLYADTEALLKDLEIDLDPRTKMVELSVANMQIIEIAKAISYNAEIIIMDEPTSAITEKEVHHLFKMVQRLKEDNAAIIYISHKMSEIFDIADEVTVLRDGEYIGTKDVANIDQNSLIKMMVGRELTEMFPKVDAEITDVKLEVKNLTKKGLFKDVSFVAKKGEILGVAGLIGAGRSEVMETVFGVREKEKGEIFIDGKQVYIKTPEQAIANKIAFLTEDRKLSGVYLMLAIRENVAIANIDSYTNKKLFNLLNLKKLEQECQIECDKLRVKTPNIMQLVGNLSGGNQQKVLLARWLLTDPDILILDEPTRGIDVGAKAEIHTLMCKLAQMGKTIIMISSELPEVLGMSDRILVMHEGKLKGILSREDASQEAILNMAVAEQAS